MEAVDGLWMAVGRGGVGEQGRATSLCFAACEVKRSDKGARLYLLQPVQARRASWASLSLSGRGALQEATMRSLLAVTQQEATIRPAQPTSAFTNGL